MSELEKNIPESEKNTLETEAEISEVGEKVVKWNAVKISKFVEWIKKKLNIQEQAVVQTTASTQSEEKVEKKNANVSVKLIEIKDVGLSPIKVYGAIKDAVKELKGEDINIIQAKKLAEKEDKIILEDIPRDKAEEFQKKIEKGAKVEIK